jgi:hypothetical protein
MSQKRRIVILRAWNRQEQNEALPQIAKQTSFSSLSYSEQK